MRIALSILFLLSVAMPQTKDNQPNSAPKVKFVPYDEAPVALSKIEPVYPEIAREAGIEGRVVVQVFIDENGKVTDTKILEGIPESGLNEAAINAVTQTKFKPAMLRDQPVGVWITIPIDFALKK